MLRKEKNRNLKFRFKRSRKDNISEIKENTKSINIGNAKRFKIN